MKQAYGVRDGLPVFAGASGAFGKAVRGTMLASGSMLVGSGVNDMRNGQIAEGAVKVGNGMLFIAGGITKPSGVGGKVVQGSGNHVPPSPLKPIPAVVQKFGPSQAEVAAAAKRITAHREALKAHRGGNFGYLEGVVNGRPVDNRIWRSTGKSSAELEPHIFTASYATGKKGNSWLRDTDTEYRMLNHFAHQMGAQPGQVYPHIAGHLKIVSEHPYCSSCSNVIEQFRVMFPNIRLTLINGVNK